MQDFEKLGLFYLGRKYDLASGAVQAEPVLYDSRDLVTHAVCVGMTGSGKTGLCLSVLEEAAIDGIPAIAIDPKGDLANLLLTFPGLAPSDFRPWIDEDEARRAGLDPEAYAAQQAQTWSRGLAEWGQDGSRIERLRRAVEMAVYTPGSRAGLPVSILSSFKTPHPDLTRDPEALAERASGTATSVLGLAGVDAPPRSREHTLLSTLLSTAWSEGRDLDLGALIQQLRTPPFEKVGVLDLESFYPSRERFELATRLNALLAAPGFDGWLEGVPLEPSSLLYTAEGRPRIAIFSIAHLGDAERMFFVSLLLNQVVGWTRGLTGTSSLRAIVYMDEIAGYFPPVANPPSKPPLLTLLKQARAFGVGVLLATQNPVDLDYKGLANTGTWFLGRLQTERDKARVLDGLEAAAAGGLDRADADRMLSALGKRVFLLHNVHEREPVVFHTRWTLSYLRGPLSRDQIRRLSQPAAPEPAAAARESEPSGLQETAGHRIAAGATGARPIVPPGIQEFFVPRAESRARGSAVSGGPLTYVPIALGAATVTFADGRRGIDITREVLYAVPITEDAVPVDWADATALSVGPGDLLKEPEDDAAAFSPLPAAASRVSKYSAWTKSFSRWLAQTQRLELLRDTELNITSRADESERDFRIRLQADRRAARDAEVDAMRRKYAPKQAALAERLRRAEAAVEREQEQASHQKLQTAVSMGATLLGALFGRKTVSTGTLGRATTAARGMGRSMKETSDVKRAAEGVETVRKQIQALENQVAADAAAIAARYEAAPPLDHLALAPKRGHVAVEFVALGWISSEGAAAR
jgi:hypothetical protein